MGPEAARLAERDEVNRVVAAWVRTLTREDVLATCRSNDVPAGPLYSIADIFEDPQYAHRETIVEVPSRIGPLAVPGRSRRCRTRPARSAGWVRSSAPTPTRCSARSSGGPPRRSPSSAPTAWCDRTTDR